MSPRREGDQFTPFISVVIPTRNRRARLERALECLQAQDYPADRFEVIVVDNASTDDTAELMASLECASLTHVRRAVNGGVGSSLNLGIEMAAGTIIAIIDDDCIADRRWLKSGAARFSESVGIVAGATLPDPDTPVHFFSRAVCYEAENPVYATCNIFYLKQALVEVGGFDETFDRLTDVLGQPMRGADTELAWRVKGRGWKSVFAEDTVAYHAVYQQSVFSWLMDGARGLDFPYILNRTPQIAWTRFFATPFTAAFDLMVVGVMLGFLASQSFLLLALPYIVLTWRRRFLSRNIKALPQFVLWFAKDSLTFVTLVLGSLRYRALWI